MEGKNPEGDVQDVEVKWVSSETKFDFEDPPPDAQTVSMQL